MKHISLTALACAAALAVAGCGRAPESQTAAPAVADVDRPVLFHNLGELSRPIGAANPEVQRWFDQGLRLAYAFNHQAAERAFAEAARLDPDCAMCFWGRALVLGPNINLPMLPEAMQPAHAHAQRALTLAERAQPADRALIEALAKRYAWPAPEDRGALDLAYADAMREVVARFPDDNDAAALFAESLMDLSPWSYWGPDGQPNEHTGEILAALEGVLARDPDHIGAIHYYIHATEASNEPHKAEPHADKLAMLSPGAGHLVHMPAHTYIRVGRYHDATLTNLAATEADAAFLSICRGSSGVYPLGYVPHNWHFATMTAGLEGASRVALNAAEQSLRRVDVAAIDQLSFMQQFAVAPLMTQLRFGRWDAVLAQSAPPVDRPYPTAIWHFARGLARARTGDIDGARAELAALEPLAADPAMAQVPLWDINAADKVLAVAVPFLRGEIAAAAGDRDTAIAELTAAVVAEDALGYNEPPDWLLPVRPYLGVALLDAGRAAEAEAVFARDLRVFPEAGWSLFGLAQAQRAQGKAAEADVTQARFERAWQWADVTLENARF